MKRHGRLLAHIDICHKDGEMSETFIKLAEDSRYTVYHRSQLGYVQFLGQDYQKGEYYKVELNCKEEQKWEA